MRYTLLLKAIFLMQLFVFISLDAKAAKIVGLAQVKNEQDIIEVFLRAFKSAVDALVVLDDGSTDATVAIVQKLASELSIERIIVNSQCEWVNGTELNNKQRLLDAGRECGGTHFIELDADEILVATAMENNRLRNSILALKPGQIIHLPLINLWKNCDQYRSQFNQNFPDIVHCSCIFCDDEVSNMDACLPNSHSGFIHLGRFPAKTSYVPEKQKDVYINDLDCAIMHMPFVNWNNVIIKRVWIMMLEAIRLQEGLFNRNKFKFVRTMEDVNSFYITWQPIHGLDETAVSPVKKEWKAYSFFDESVFVKRNLQPRVIDIRKWVDTYGLDYFRPLEDIFQYIELVYQGIIS